ncbi:hypothetical protein HYQ45_005226 [Verticillium longisporum]|uniref:Uncharacterized protein n=1 Tax=Verticillium longisporum TaxID=100787 RepID=A0A8I3ATU1_VERLO|nr:hypothetical protein HYQ45_005226 [Verticillium longisporum]
MTLLIVDLLIRRAGPSLPRETTHTPCGSFAAGEPSPRESVPLESLCDCASPVDSEPVPSCEWLDYGRLPSEAMGTREWPDAVDGRVVTALGRWRRVRATFMTWLPLTLEIDS